MTESQYNSLASSRFTKIVCPFGVVVAGTSLYPVSNMHYAANVVASLLDSKNTGSAKDEDVRREMSASGHLQALIGGGASFYDEEACYHINQGWRCFSLYSWKHENNQDKIKETIQNQVFDIYSLATDAVWGKTYQRYRPPTIGQYSGDPKPLGQAPEKGEESTIFTIIAIFITLFMLVTIGCICKLAFKENERLQGKQTDEEAYGEAFGGETGRELNQDPQTLHKTADDLKDFSQFFGPDCNSSLKRNLTR